MYIYIDDFIFFPVALLLLVIIIYCIYKCCKNSSEEFVPVDEAPLVVDAEKIVHNSQEPVYTGL